MKPDSHHPHEPTPEQQQEIHRGMLRAELSQLADASAALLRHETEGKTASARKQAGEDREAILARMAEIAAELGEYSPHNYQVPPQ